MLELPSEPPIGRRDAMGCSRDDSDRFRGQDCARRLRHISFGPAQCARRNGIFCVRVYAIAVRGGALWPIPPQLAGVERTRCNTSPLVSQRTRQPVEHVVTQNKAAQDTFRLFIIMESNAHNNNDTKVEENPWLDETCTQFDKPIAVIDSDSEEEDDQLVFQDVQLFCHAIQAPELSENFIKHKVTLGQLLLMDEQDLVNCGIELVGDRKKILANTATMHCEKWMPTSLQDMTAQSLLSSPGIYVSINDINKHIEYIGVTLRYIRRRLQSNPEVLELGKDYVGVSKIHSELQDLEKTSKATYNQINALTRQISKHLDDPNYKPANHIDRSYLRRAKIHQKIKPVILTILTLFVSFKLSKLLS